MLLLLIEIDYFDSVQYINSNLTCRNLYIPYSFEVSQLFYVEIYEARNINLVNKLESSGKKRVHSSIFGLHYEHTMYMF